jgi:hypothetical protein
MKTLRVFGIWTLEKEHEKNTYPEYEIAEIHGKAAFYPFYKNRMKLWLEGCMLWHVNCDNCKFCLTIEEGNGEIFDKLVGILHE